MINSSRSSSSSSSSHSISTIIIILILILLSREFTKGGFGKGGFAIYAFPLCNCNTLGSVFNVEIENTPNCYTPFT